MNVYTNTGNPNTLKILIAGRFAAVNIAVIFKNSDEQVIPFLQRGCFPVLEYEKDKYLFSSNQACRYIFKKFGTGKSDANIEQFLELESSTLQPLFHHVLCCSHGHGKLDQSVYNYVDKLMKNLNTEVTSKCLNGECNAAVIVLWCSLYPLFCSGSPIKEYRAKFTNVSQWFDRLWGLPEFQGAVQLVTQTNHEKEIKEYILSRPAPLLPLEFSKKLTLEKCNIKVHQEAQGEKGATGIEADAPSRPPVTKEELSEVSQIWTRGIENRPKTKQRLHPILPQVGEKNKLITSALPYVNNVPHLGNIIGCVLSADVYSRFCRLRNYNSLYICGTDEYGTATETKAVEEGLTPQQICDKYNKLHSEIYSWFNIGFDYFGRTTTSQQTEIAQDIFWQLNTNGYILKDSVEQLQCVNCNRFLADRFVEGTCPFCTYEDARGDQCDKCGKLINAVELLNPRCKVCGQVPIVKSSDHLFMDLPSLEPLLQKHLDKAFKEGLWTSNTKQITNSWLRDGLKPRCITRDLKWGTPVPMEGYKNKVFYVWYDAPIGYISITANYCDQWQQWWKNPQQVELYNFMAKDNVPFHSVIFPSSLLGTTDSWTVVNHLSATEYLNYEDGKFSKSRGIGVFGNDAQNTGIPADIWRFYLLYVRPETQDSAFSWDDFMTKNNSELLNNLGNFINRALMFVANQFGGKIPEMQLRDDEKELLALITRELKAYVDNLEKIRLRDGIRNILSISRLGNQYIQANKPWVKVKGSPEEKKEAGTVVGLAANIACMLSIMVQPYMPQVSKTIQAQLNTPDHMNVITVNMDCLLPSGHVIGKPNPLFQKMEQKLIDELKKRFAGTQKERKMEQAQENIDSVTSPSNVGTPAAKASPQEIQLLTEKVTQQGNHVRELKASKAEKSAIDEAVGVLLSLKKQLAQASGVDPQESGTGGKKKGKGKRK